MKKNIFLLLALAFCTVPTCFSMEREKSLRANVKYTQIVVVPVAHNGHKWRVALEHDNNQWALIKYRLSIPKVINQKASNMAAYILREIINEPFEIATDPSVSLYDKHTETVTKLYLVQLLPGTKSVTENPLLWISVNKFTEQKQISRKHKRKDIPVDQELFDQFKKYALLEQLKKLYNSKRT